MRGAIMNFLMYCVPELVQQYQGSIVVYLTIPYNTIQYYIVRRCVLSGRRCLCFDDVWFDGICCDDFMCMPLNGYGAQK